MSERQSYYLFLFVFVAGALIWMAHDMESLSESQRSSAEEQSEPEKLANWEEIYNERLGSQAFLEAARVANNNAPDGVRRSRIMGAFDQAVAVHRYDEAIKVMQEETEIISTEDVDRALMQAYDLAMGRGDFLWAVMIAEEVSTVREWSQAAIEEKIRAAYDQALAKDHCAQAYDIALRRKFVPATRAYWRDSYDATGKVVSREELQASYADACPHSYDMECPWDGHQPIRLCNFYGEERDPRIRKLQGEFVKEAVRQIAFMNQNLGAKYCEAEQQQNCDARGDGCRLEEIVQERDRLFHEVGVPTHDRPRWEVILTGRVQCDTVPLFTQTEFGPLPANVLSEIEDQRHYFLNECARQGIQALGRDKPDVNNVALKKILLAARTVAWKAVPTVTRGVVFRAWHDECAKQGETRERATARFLLSGFAGNAAMPVNWICSGGDYSTSIDWCGDLSNPDVELSDSAIQQLYGILYALPEAQTPAP